MKTSKPEEVGLSTERLKRISGVMQRYIDERELAGVLTMVARRGCVVHAEASWLAARLLERSPIPPRRGKACGARSAASWKIR